jgi:hypothetical protein
VHTNQIIDDPTRQVCRFLVVFPDGIKRTFINIPDPTPNMKKKKNRNKIQICLRKLNKVFTAAKELEAISQSRASIYFCMYKTIHLGV